MKIGKILLWGAGIGTAIWAAKKFLFKPAVNPATGQGIPPRTTTSGVRDTTANFAGKKAQDYVSTGYVSTAFNGEFPDDGINEGFDMFSGTSRIARFFGLSSERKFIEPYKSSGGTLSCPKGYHLTTDKDGAKWCTPDQSMARLIPGKKDKYNKKISDLKQQGLVL